MVQMMPVTRSKAFLLEGRGLTLFLAFGVALMGIIFFGNRAYHFTHYSVAPNSLLVVTAAPGQKIFLTLNVGSSLNGLWGSSQGLSMTLKNPANFSSQVVAPQEPAWSPLTTIDNASGEELILNGSFIVPKPDQAATTVLSGQLSGEIVYPDPDGDETYHDQFLHISVPITILLISPEVVFSNELLPVYLLSSAGILLLLLIPITYRVYDVRRPHTLF